MTHPHGKRGKAAAHEPIELEHEQIRMLARKICTAEHVPALLALLKEYRNMLRHHFAAEEAPDGLYDALLHAAPERKQHLDSLRAQHAHLIDEVEELISLAQANSRDRPVTQAEVFTLAARVGANLGDHEAEETNLIFDVFYTDLGVGD